MRLCLCVTDRRLVAGRSCPVHGLSLPRRPLYLGVFSILIGNLLMVYSMMAGCMHRELHGAMRSMLAIPLYWALMSVAAYKALFQLLRPSRRHYWELTEHGLVTEHGHATEHGHVAEHAEQGLAATTLTFPTAPIQGPFPGFAVPAILSVPADTVRIWLRLPYSNSNASMRSPCAGQGGRAGRSRKSSASPAMGR
jgi:hypothetical protein